MNSASLNIEKLIPKFRVLPYFRESNVIALAFVTCKLWRERERESVFFGCKLWDYFYATINLPIFLVRPPDNVACKHKPKTELHEFLCCLCDCFLYIFQFLFFHKPIIIEYTHNK